MASPRLGLPHLGCGVGLRKQHYPELFAERPAIDFLEVVSENFMVAGGPPLANLDRARALCPLVQHGVSLGIGAVAPLDFDYLKQLKALTRRTGTPWVTDHLCWTRAGGVDLHDLLPLPYTEEALRHVAARARVVQDYLELPLGLENVSSYLAYESSTMPEEAFLGAVVEEANCGILLDVNNVYVSSENHGFDARAYLDAIPAHRVVQIHLAGHTRREGYLLDTHDDFVLDEVWALYRHAVARIGPVSTLVEWDAHIPELAVVWGEAKKAAAILAEVADAA
jgi:uncharacterized protein